MIKNEFIIWLDSTIISLKTEIILDDRNSFELIMDKPPL